VAISGSGNVATYTAEKLMQLGAVVVSMSDSDGSIYAADGLTEDQLKFIFELKNVYRGRIREVAEEYPDTVKYFPANALAHRKVRHCHALSHPKRN